MSRLLIADDHVIFRQGLSTLIQKEGKIEIVAEVSNGIEAWDKIQELRPELAILDFSMPEMNGLQVAEMVLKNNLPTLIILLTMNDEVSIIAKSKKFQVKGYVLKDNTFEELIVAIKEVSAGRSFYSSIIKEKLKSYNTKDELSTRETTVLKLVAQGLTNKEIALQLKISHKTVDTYRSRLMSKLDLHSIAELTNYAIKTGLV